MENRKVIVVLGKTGCGKTTLAKKIRAKFNTRITLDPLQEYDGTIFESLFDAFEYFKIERSFYNVTCRFTSDIEHDFLFRLSWILSNHLLCVEETDNFLDPRSTNYNFLQLVKYGRHQNISLLCVARRVPELSIHFRSQATSIYTFRQTEPNDLRFLEELGFDAVKISSLNDYEFDFIGDPVHA